MKNKAIIVLLTVAYAFINYYSYVYKFIYNAPYLNIVKDSSEFLKNNDNSITHFNVGNSIFFTFFTSTNFHVFLLCIFIQYHISLLLNSKKHSFMLLFFLVFFFTLRSTGFFLSHSNNHILQWFGLNIYSRLVSIYNFLFYFPSLPFLIFLINKNIGNKKQL